MQTEHRQRTGSIEGRTLIRQGSSCERGVQFEAPEISIDPQAGRIVVVDRGETFGYELGWRRGRGRAGGFGWSELTRGEHDVVFITAVTASEVMAVCRDGHRHEDVAAITLAGAETLGACKSERAMARRLAAEVRAGYEAERVSLRAIQARIVAQLVEGATLTDLCVRGGFVDRDGRIDTTWLERRAGLMAARCSRTGKVRTARTASYPIFCRLLAAVDAEPHEFDV